MLMYRFINEQAISERHCKNSIDMSKLINKCLQNGYAT